MLALASDHPEQSTATGENRLAPGFRFRISTRRCGAYAVRACESTPISTAPMRVTGSPGFGIPKAIACTCTTTSEDPAPTARRVTHTASPRCQGVPLRRGLSATLPHHGGSLSNPEERSLRRPQDAIGICNSVTLRSEFSSSHSWYSSRLRPVS